MQGRKIAHCHKKIAEVAKEAAAASYDELMSNDFMYTAWKNKFPQHRNNPKRLKLAFVQRHWGKYIDFARTTLGLLLRQPIDDKVKEEIVEVLALDQTLVRGRVAPAIVAGTVVNK